MQIGVFALQGDFEKHERALRRLGVDTVYVNYASQLSTLDAVILPGGESSTMLKLLDVEGLFEPLKQFAAEKPIFGTCAGTILLATEVTSPSQRSLGAINMTVERNAYGRQLDSSIQTILPEKEFEDRTRPGELETVFIRAPIIREIRGGARVLASLEGNPILVEEGRHLAATFHPEMTEDTRVHELFLRKARKKC